MNTWSPVTRASLLIFALVALIGPNGMFLYYAFSEPSLMQEANANPIALAFMIEAMMLLVLFLAYVWSKSRSVARVVWYLMLTFIGSLAFSFAVYLYVHSKSRVEVP